MKEERKRRRWRGKEEEEEKRNKEGEEEGRRQGKRRCTHFSVRCHLVMRRRINTEAVDGFMVGYVTWGGLCCCMALCGDTRKMKVVASVTRLILSGTL